MKPQQRWFKMLSTAIMLILMGVVWITFAPAQFGGRVVYVIVTGNSMEPGFHRGDLVILRQASDYQVGDIATYHHPDVGPIIHRIVAREADHFVFKGDNNTWTDSYQPVQAEIIGKFWLHVPSAGRIIEQARTPWVMALLAAAIGVVFMTTIAAGQPWGRKRRRRDRRPTEEQHRSMSHLGENKADLLFALAALAFASLLLALFAFTRPLTRSISTDVTYQHNGVFSYSAAAPPGIYDSGAVQTGEPVFRQLITVVNVNFDYQFVSDQPGDLDGAYRLMAEISHSNGWRWTLELQPETAFNGNAFSAGGVVDLNQIQTLIDSLEQQTGLQRQQYTLAIGPEMVINGTLAGQELHDQFSPRLTFRLDELQMQLAPGDPTITDPLKPSQTGLLKLVREAPNTLSLLGLQLKVSTARQLALAGLALFLGWLLVLGLAMFRAARGDEASRIQVKYGSLLIAVHDSGLEASKRVVEVATIDDLAKLAERDGRMILHQIRDSTHHYFVQGSSVTYHYRLADHEGETAVQAEERAL